jgi:hypothetical protein
MLYIVLHVLLFKLATDESCESIDIVIPYKDIDFLA